MNKLDSKLQHGSFPISSISYSDIEPVRRFIVLVPDVDLDYAAATRRVWKLADDSRANILFLSLYKDVSRESSLLRQLIMMTAMIQDGNVEAEAKVAYGNNWVDVVKSNWQTGDVIVCFAEQRSGFLYRPLNQILEAKLDAPVYILSGLYTRTYSSSNWVSQPILWIGFIGIMGGFFVIQSRIGLLSNDWMQTTLLIITVIFEFWLISVWNNLFH